MATKISKIFFNGKIYHYLLDNPSKKLFEG